MRVTFHASYSGPVDRDVLVKRHGGIDQTAVVPDAVSNRYARTVKPQMPLEWKVRKRRVTCETLGNCAFLIPVERVKGVVVETRFVSATETRWLLVGEGRRAGAIARVVDGEVLRGRGVFCRNAPMLLSVGTWP